MLTSHTEQFGGPILEKLVASYFDLATALRRQSGTMSLHTADGRSLASGSYLTLLRACKTDASATLYGCEIAAGGWSDENFSSMGFEKLTLRMHAA